MIKVCTLQINGRVHFGACVELIKVLDKIDNQLFVYDNVDNHYKDATSPVALLLSMQQGKNKFDAYKLDLYCLNKEDKPSIDKELRKHKNKPLYDNLKRVEDAIPLEGASFTVV